MFIQEREEEIMKILEQKKAVTVRDLSRKLYVSEATIRRDLNRMEHSGAIRRSHGGAVLVEGIKEDPSLLVREQENIGGKQKIARKAVDFIRPSDTVFLDSSSTAGEVISLLKGYDFLTVITNGMKNALRLSRETEAEVYMAGGHINSRSGAALDGDTAAYFMQRYADVAMVSCNGVEPEHGITDASPEHSRIKKLMLGNARTKILLCTGNKFGLTYMCRTADFSEIDYLITDKAPDSAIREVIEGQGCEVVF